MNIENELRKEGIEVVEKLNTLTVNSIATNIAQKLVNTLPDQNINYHELFMKLSRLTMYIAKLPNNSAAKYFYKNSSIYFSEKADLENLSDVIIHECSHLVLILLMHHLAIKLGQHHLLHFPISYVLFVMLCGIAQVFHLISSRIYPYPF